jgi:hypothetical protein
MAFAMTLRVAPDTTSFHDSPSILERTLPHPVTVTSSVYPLHFGADWFATDSDVFHVRKQSLNFSGKYHREVDSTKLAICAPFITTNLEYGQLAQC